MEQTIFKILDESKTGEWCRVRLENEINTMLKGGWKLHGAQYEAGERIFQPMVKTINPIKEILKTGEAVLRKCESSKEIDVIKKQKKEAWDDGFRYCLDMVRNYDG